VIVFVVALAALSGLAWLVSMSTEAAGANLGPDVTGVLQSAFGNIPEIFVVLFALAAGETVVAVTSVIGSILANALLALGLVIVVGAHASEEHVMRFHKRLSVETSTLLILSLSVIVLVGLPTTSKTEQSHIFGLSEIGSVALLVVYASWLFRYLKDALKKRDEERDDRPAAGERHVPIRLALGLLAAGGLASGLVADWFVSSLGPALETLHIPEAFAGLVIVGIAGNAVENATGLVLAAKRQNDLAVSVVAESLKQIALLVFPVLILASSFFSTRLTFQLEPIYIGALVLSAIALWQIMGDGEGYTFEGLALIAVFVIVAAFTSSALGPRTRIPGSSTSVRSERSTLWGTIGPFPGSEADGREEAQEPRPGGHRARGRRGRELLREGRRGHDARARRSAPDVRQEGLHRAGRHRAEADPGHRAHLLAERFAGAVRPAVGHRRRGLVHARADLEVDERRCRVHGGPAEGVEEGLDRRLRADLLGRGVLIGPSGPASRQIPRSCEDRSLAHHGGHRCQGCNPTTSTV
jgi:Ca2+:H+ antiporter